MTASSRSPQQQSLWVVEDGPQPGSAPGLQPSDLLEELAGDLDEFVTPLVETLPADQPLTVDILAAAVACALRVVAGDPAVSPPPETLDQATARTEPDPGSAEQFGEALVGVLADGTAGGRAGFGDGLRALAVYGGPLAASAAAAVTKLELDTTLVTRDAGRARINAAHLAAYTNGDAFEIVLDLSYPHTDGRPGYLLTFDSFDGPSIMGLDAAEDVDELLIEMRDHPTLVHVAEVPIADALATIHHAFWVLDRTIGGLADDDEVFFQRPFIDHLLASHPRSDVVLRPGLVEVTDEERHRLTAGLTAWVESNEPSLADAAATFAPVIVDFGADRAGDPHRWTPTVAIRFLESASTSVAAPTEDLQALPGLVRQTIAWSHAHNRWSAEVTNEALGAVDRVVPLFRAELEGRDVSGPEAVAVLGGLIEALGADDVEGVHQLRGIVSDALGAGSGLRGLEPPAGGDHPEPFDEAGIPRGLSDAASAIAEAASTLAADIFDDEFVTLVRRFTADVARHSASPLGRGKPEIWASGVVYAVAQLNDIPGGWNPLSLSASALTARLTGASGTITNKARELRSLLDLGASLGVPRYQHSKSTLDVDALLGGLDLIAGLRSRAVARPEGLGSAGIDDGCFVLRASLVDIRPEIWRRIRIPIDATFAQLHELLQLTFGWYDQHLHEFDIDGFRIGSVLDHVALDNDADEAQVRLCDALTPGSELVYTYDFGDGWQHGIVVEELQLGGSELEYGPWALLGGKMAAPPEDCGGPWGYRELLKATKDEHHPRREDVADFLPSGFNPKRFDVTTTNRAVQSRDWSTPHRPRI